MQSLLLLLLVVVVVVVVLTLHAACADGTPQAPRQRQHRTHLSLQTGSRSC
jgi:hypothetical protein